MTAAPEPGAKAPGPVGAESPPAPPVAPTNPVPALPGLVVPAAPNAKWVPLVPAAQSMPSGVAARSGAFLMTATKADAPIPRPPSGPTGSELEIRGALISCLEALVPHLEPGWTHCTEHPGCRAVQEGTHALWGGPRPPNSPADAPGAAPSAPATGDAPPRPPAPTK